MCSKVYSSGFTGIGKKLHSNVVDVDILSNNQKKKINILLDVEKKGKRNKHQAMAMAKSKSILFTQNVLFFYPVLNLCVGCTLCNY